MFIWIQQVQGAIIGNPPDPRAIATGESLGFELSRLRARQVSLEDFYII